MRVLTRWTAVAAVVAAGLFSTLASADSPDCERMCFNRYLECLSTGEGPWECTEVYDNCMKEHCSAPA